MMLATSANAYDFMEDGLCYRIVRNAYGATAAVTYDTSYTSLTGDVVIPETVSNSNHTYKVLSIDDWAFQYCRELTSVTIGNNVTKIGNRAFSGCTSLTKINFGRSITTIPDGAFCDCNGLTSIDIPSPISVIGSQAFARCTGLTEVSFGSTINTIGGSAFEGCTALNQVSIPTSVSTIGYDAFRNTAIYMNAPNGMYYVDHWLCGYKGASPSGNKQIEPGTVGIADKALNNTRLEVISIPNSVKWMGGEAFASCRRLRNVSIGNGVDAIGNSAFSGCESLQSITIPNSIATIGSNAFRGCKSLFVVDIPNSVTAIGDGAFYGCEILYSVRIGNSVTVIGSHAFDFCGNLESVSFGNSVETIGEYAFRGAKTISNVSLPSSVVTIGVHAFENCLGLNTVALGDNVRTIGDYAFSGCTALTNVAMGKSVSVIGKDAFAGTGIKSVVVPNSVTTIGSGAFSNCKSLECIDFGSNLTSISTSMFFGCSNLKSFNIPKSCSKFEGGLSDFTNLRCITNLSVTPQEHGEPYDDSFLRSLCRLRVPLESIDKYRQASFWRGFRVSAFTETEFVTDNLCYHSDDDGATAYVKSMPAGMVAPRGEVIIPETVTYDEVTYIVDAIRDDAFSGCTSLTCVTIPSSVTMISNGAFYDCTGLQCLTNLSLKPQPIGYYTFYNVNTHACKLLVPEEAIECYKTANYWKDFLINDLSAIEGIAVEPDLHHRSRYNMQGQPVGNGYRGIVIERGRKIIVW